MTKTSWENFSLLLALFHRSICYVQVYVSVCIYILINIFMSVCVYVCIILPYCSVVMVTSMFDAVHGLLNSLLMILVQLTLSTRCV